MGLGREELDVYQIEIKYKPYCIFYGTGYGTGQFDFDPDSDLDPDKAELQQTDMPDAHFSR